MVLWGNYWNVEFLVCYGDSPQFGLAILGAIMNRNFVRGFVSNLPPQVVSTFSPEQINALTQNPQALISPEASAELQITLAGTGLSAYYDQVFLALRESLATAIAGIFLISMTVVIVAFIINLFIKEIPLRRQQNVSVKR